MRNRKPGEKGFTLMELMIVLALIALITSFAQPKYMRAMGKAKLVDAANVLRIGAANIESSCAVNNVTPSEGSASNYATQSINFNPPTVSGGCADFKIVITPKDGGLPTLCIKRVSESSFLYGYTLAGSYTSEDIPIATALIDGNLTCGTATTSGAKSP